MQDIVVVGLIVEELSNINIKCVKYRSRSPCQGTCRESTSRRSIIQDLVVEGLTVEDIWKGNVKGVKVNGARNIGQGVHTLRRSTTQGLVVVGLIVEILNVDLKCVKCTGAQNIGQDTCRVSTSRRSTMQGLVARGFTLEEIWNVDGNYVKVTAARI